MTTFSNRILGRWFRANDGRVFRVIAVDSVDDTIEVQGADGEVEEFDPDIWMEIDPAPVESPSHGDRLLVISDEDADVGGVHTLSDLLDQFEHHDYH